MKKLRSYGSWDSISCDVGILFGDFCNMVCDNILQHGMVVVTTFFMAFFVFSITSSNGAAKLQNFWEGFAINGN